VSRSATKLILPASGGGENANVSGENPGAAVQPEVATVYAG
jgi:hypothetical protein